MSVSHNAIHTALGIGAGSNTLSELYTNAFTRTGTPYRVNPFKVQSSWNATTPHNLNDWEGYSHTIVNAGSNLEDAGGGYQSKPIAWVKPTGGAGYQNDCLTQKVYWKEMSSCEDLSVDPFTGGSNADVGDGSSYTITGLNSSKYYAIGVKCEFNDGTNTYLSIGAEAKAGEQALTGGGLGISSGLIWANTPSLGTVTQSPLSSDCYSGPVTINVPMNMNGTSAGTLQYSSNNSVWNNLSTSIAAGGGSYPHTNRASEQNHYYRLSYNDVSGPLWSPVKSIYATCTKI